MIFIVDDDAATRDSLRQLLEVEGFEACEFVGGRPFLDGVRATDGDCLILDLNMPGMNGFDVLAELRRRGAGLPVIVVPAHAVPATLCRAAAGGALAVLEKPHRTSELLALVRRALAIGL